MSNTLIIYGDTGQTLTHVPPARVASATYSLEDLTRADDDADRVLASGSATVPSWTITSSATAGASQSNSARISTTSTTGASIGAVASIVGTDGQRETFTIDAIGTDSYVEAVAGLAGTYAAGATVYGLELSAAVPDSLAADEDILEQERPLRIVWRYTLDGAAYVVPAAVQFKRHGDAPMGVAGEAMVAVQTLYPDLPGRLAEGADIERVIGRLAQEVSNDLRAHGKPPESFLTGPQGVGLVVARTLMLAAEHGYAPGRTDPDAAYRAEARGHYKDALERLVMGVPGRDVVQTTHVSDQSHQAHSQIAQGPTLRM